VARGRRSDIALPIGVTGIPRLDMHIAPALARTTCPDMHIAVVRARTSDRDTHISVV
jgi:hypothetical protein